MCSHKVGNLICTHRADRATCYFGLSYKKFALCKVSSHNQYLHQAVLLDRFRHADDSVCLCSRMDQSWDTMVVKESSSLCWNDNQLPSVLIESQGRECCCSVPYTSAIVPSHRHRSSLSLFGGDRCTHNRVWSLLILLRHCWRPIIFMANTWPNTYTHIGSIN